MPKLSFPQWSQKIVDPQTGLATRDFYRFLQELWVVGSGGENQTISADDLQIQDTFEGLPEQQERGYSRQFLTMGG